MESSKACREVKDSWDSLIKLAEEIREKTQDLNVLAYETLGRLKGVETEPKSDSPKIEQPINSTTYSNLHSCLEKVLNLTASTHGFIRTIGE
jgi:hypothetical protein